MIVKVVFYVIVSHLIKLLWFDRAVQKEGREPHLAVLTCTMLLIFIML